MAITGVYKVAVVQYEDSFDMELHIKEEKHRVFASLKDGILTRSFYNGRTTPWPGREAYNFIFYNAQVDDFVNIKVPGEDRYVTLTPPGGYHIGGVEFGGTVVDGVVTGAIILKGGLVQSVSGHRIEGEPVVNTEFRTDGLPGKNSYCTCPVAACTHHGFCDSCNIYDSIPVSKTFRGKGIPLSQCLIKQYEKIFGPLDIPPMEKYAGEPDHGPSHFAEEEE